MNGYILGYIEVLYRTILAFIIPLALAKLLGKQVVSNMTFHDFVTAITIGGIAANLAFNLRIQTGHLVASLVIFAATSYLVSVIALKFRFTRKWVSGVPTVVIKDGKILEDNMKKIKYTMDSLNDSLREKDVFDISEVDYALLEVNGKLAVKKKDEYTNVTKKDLNLGIPGEPKLPVELIMEGKILHKNIRQNPTLENEIRNHLNKMNKKVEDVFYAVQGSNKQLFIDFYQDGIHKPTDQKKS